MLIFQYLFPSCRLLPLALLFFCAVTGSIRAEEGLRAHGPRIFFTSLRKLIALDAATGERIPGFGENGEIHLEVAYSGALTLYKDIIIIGANFFGPGELHIGPQLTQPRGQDGDSRAFSAVTGEKLWQYNTIPGPGEPGHETWGKESWRDRTGNNVWAFALTVDEAHGIVYMPVSSPGANYYGGDRPGNNEPANATVQSTPQAANCSGKYFQNIHMDYNITAIPMTYQGKDGRQYVGVVAARAGFSVGARDQGKRRAGRGCTCFPCLDGLNLRLISR